VTRSAPLWLAALAAALFVSITLAVMIGPVSIRPDIVWRIALDHAVPGWLTPAWQPFERSIVWDIRLPRVLLAAIAGAGLAVVGATLQALLRNPLADPYLLGTSSGAALGAVGVLLFGASALGGLSVSLAAFAGALAAIAIVYVLAWQDGRFPTGRLVLSGVAVSYLCSSITNLMIFRAPGGEQARTALFWMLGGLSGAQWTSLGLPAAVVFAGTAALIAFARMLNALSLGEETAATLGVDTNRFRRLGFVVASLSTGVLVAMTGGIGFVGLMVPHFVRLAVGADHRRLLPAAALAGAPFFLWLMRARARGGWTS